MIEKDNSIAQSMAGYGLLDGQFGEPADITEDEDMMVAGPISNILRKRVQKKARKEAEEYLKKTGKELPPTYKDPEQLLKEAEEIPAGELQGRSEAPPFQTGRRNVNLDHLNDPHVKRLTEVVNRHEDGWQAMPQRQPQTHAETIKKSQTYGVQQEVENKLNYIRRGKVDPNMVKWHPEEMVALFKQYELQGQELQNLAVLIRQKKIDKVLAPEDLAEFQNKLLSFRATQEVISGAVADAGRLLNSLQAINKTGLDYYANVDNLVKMGGGEASILKKAQLIADAEDLAGLDKSVNDSWAEKAKRNIIAIRYNLMLSSIRTHGANILGSLTTGAYETFGVGLGRVVWSGGEWAVRLGKMKREDMYTISDWATGVSSMIKSTKDSFQVAKKVLKGEMIDNEAGKVYNEMGIRLRPDELQDRGVIKKIGTIPTQMLEAEDAFFKSQFYNQKLAELASAKSKAIGGTAAEIKENYRKLMDDPPWEMKAEAKQFAKELTFTNDPSIYGKLIGTMAQGLTQMQQNHMFFQLLVPFVQTPSNILGYTLNATGLGKIVQFRQLAKDLADPRKRADTISRLSISAGLFYLLHDAWADGKITGIGPNNPSEKKMWESTGWRANAYRTEEGDYYELNRLDPTGQTLGIIASIYDLYYGAETEEDAKAAVAGGVLTIAELVKDRSYLAILTDFITAMGQPGSKLKPMMAIGGSMASSLMIPNIARDVREMADPYRRSMEYEATSEGFGYRLLHQTMNAMPWVSKKLPPVPDWKGDVEPAAGNFLWRGTIPVRITKSQQDAASMAMVQNGIGVPRLDHTVIIPNSGGAKVRLLQQDPSGWLLYEFRRRVGKAQHQAAEKHIKSAGYRRAERDGNIGPDTDAALELKAEVDKARQKAKKQFINELQRGKITHATFPGGTHKIEYKHDVTKEMVREVKKDIKKKGKQAESQYPAIKTPKGGTLLPSAPHF